MPLFWHGFDFALFCLKAPLDSYILQRANIVWVNAFCWNIWKACCMTYRKDITYFASQCNAKAEQFQRSRDLAICLANEQELERRCIIRLSIADTSAILWITMWRRKLESKKIPHDLRPKNWFLVVSLPARWNGFVTRQPRKIQWKKRARNIEMWNKCEIVHGIFPIPVDYTISFRTYFSTLLVFYSTKKIFFFFFFVCGEQQPMDDFTM